MRANQNKGKQIQPISLTFPQVPKNTETPALSLSKVILILLIFFIMIIFHFLTVYHKIYHNLFRYVADMSRQRAESLLKSEDKEGCFVVRNSSQKGLYTLSLFTKVPHSQVKHYHIKQNAQGFYLSEKHCCPTIPELFRLLTQSYQTYYYILGRCCHRTKITNSNFLFNVPPELPNQFLEKAIIEIDFIQQKSIVPVELYQKSP